jgi:hypothetical protein
MTKIVLFSHLRPGDVFYDKNSGEYFLITKTQYFVCPQEPVHPNFLLKTMDAFGEKYNFYESPNCPVYFKDLILVSNDIVNGEDCCQYWKEDKVRESLEPPPYSVRYEMLNINLKLCR